MSRTYYRIICMPTYFLLFLYDAPYTRRVTEQNLVGLLRQRRNKISLIPLIYSFELLYLKIGKTAPI